MNRKPVRKLTHERTQTPRETGSFRRTQTPLETGSFSRTQSANRREETAPIRGKTRRVTK